MTPHSPLTESRVRAAGRVLNFAIIATALLLTGILARNFFSGRTQAKAITPQAKLFIKGVDWSRSEHTLLLAIRKDCEFSTRSAPFYRRLLQAGGDRVRIVAVFPNETSEGQAYLDELGLPVSEFKQVSISTLGINSVPTLALLDREGVVSAVWTGQLTPSREAEVMDKLRLKDPRPPGEWSMDEGELKRRRERREPLVVLDLRGRDEFAQAHMAEARNIPLDELNVRAINELSPDDTIVLFNDDSSRTESAYTALTNQGFNRVFVLRQTPAGR